MKKILLFIFFFFMTFVNVLAADEYLKNILIDGVALEDFDSSKTDYNLNYGSDKESIKITFDYDTSLYKGKGSYGDIKLNYGNNNISFTVTSISDETNSMTYNLNITREDSRSSDNSLASLTVGTQNVILSDKNEYDVSVSNDLKTVEVKAVLKDSKASFVSGYGERTGNNAVTLNGERTKIEIKVKAENENERTYTINIIKTDYKSNDATLKTLDIEGVDYTFNSNTYEYNLSVANDIETVKINATPNHEAASVEYDEEVNLDVGLNKIVVSVTAEDGTKRDYTINLTRQELVPLVANITISGIDFEFQSDVYNYTIETTLTTLEFNITLNDEEATFEVLNNENLENGSEVVVEVTKDDEVVRYSFAIVNEDDAEDLNNGDNNENNNQHTNNSSLYETLKKYEMYIGLGVFGLGLLSLLIAILTKPKKSQIM